MKHTFTLEQLSVTSQTLQHKQHAAQLSCVRSGDRFTIRIGVDYCAAYGLGERFNSVNQKNLDVLCAVQEKFCYQGALSYCPAPFFFVDSGFGFFVQTDRVTSYRFEDAIWVELEGEPNIVLHVFTGAPQEIICQYMQLTGEAKLPPKWAFGPWVSANMWNTQVQIEQQLALIQKHDFPVSVMVIEAWSDEATFYIFNGAAYRPVSGGEALRYEDFDFSQSEHWQDPKGMIDALHDQGIRLMLWQIPVYKKQSSDELPNVQNDIDREYARKQQLCVRMPDGAPYTIPEGNWFAGSMIPDFTNPQTKQLWFEKRRYLLEMGVDGFKTDGGEFIYRDDVQFDNGATGKEMKNRYAQTYVDAYTQFIGDDRALFSRAGYTGQHSTPILWAGDQQSTWAEFGNALKAGLSAGLSGIPFWSFDIAGFAGPLPSLDLYRRSTQTAVFVPIMQWHAEPSGGQFAELMPSAEGNNERSPWNIAHVYQTPELIDEMRYWHNLRMNLLPCIYCEGIKAVQTHAPVMKHLFYEYPDDMQCVDIEDQFMIGDLLIAPVMVQDATAREVYLPAGMWFDFFTGKAYEGGRILTHKCGTKRLPVFIRSGGAAALNLDQSQALGSAVGNGTDGYRNLCFMLAGSTGEYRFVDDLGNDFVLSWRDGKYQTVGRRNTGFEVLWRLGDSDE